MQHDRPSRSWAYDSRDPCLKVPTMIRRRETLSALALAFTLLLTDPAAAQFKSLLRRVPEQANAILLLDLDAIKSSRVGIKEKWAAKQKENHLTGVTNIPPNVTDL